MSRFELLVGSTAFWRRAAGDIARARRRVLVQAMSFEGDATGQAVASAIGASPAEDRRVLVDDYTRWVVNDRLVRSPFARRDAALRAEVVATGALFEGLMDIGVGVRLTNPIGPLFGGYPARNHKKLIVADDAAYLGGINFSDHNFAWDDFMVRLDGAEVADFLAADFAATFAAEPRPARAAMAGLTLHSLDGRANDAAFDEVLALIAAAERTITVVSPYLTFPFTEALAKAAGQGVAVRLITALASNKPMVRDYLLTFARRAGFEVRLLPRMIHLKGMLIDDAILIAGSSNFDFVSLAAEEEFIAVITDAGLIEAFRRQVVDPAIAEALPPGSGPAAPSANRAYLALRLAQAVARRSRGAARTAIDWPRGGRRSR